VPNAELSLPSSESTSVIRAHQKLQTYRPSSSKWIISTVPRDQLGKVHCTVVGGYLPADEWKVLVRNPDAAISGLFSRK
jgi:hypothetical protein